MTRIIGLVEPWVDEKQWNKLTIREKLPQKYKLKCQIIRKEKSKERANGGIVTGIRRQKKEIIDRVDDIQERRLKIDKKAWRIFNIYNGGYLISIIGMCRI